MFSPSIHAPAKFQRSTNLALSISVAALIALAACDSAASSSPTSGLAASSDAPRASAGIVAPVSTPGPVRPPGVPANAQPLLYGCKAGLPRCEGIAPGTYYTAGEWALLPGLVFTLPSGWSSLANEAGELELHRNGDDHDEILIWRDVVPWLDSRASLAAASDPEAWIGHLRGNPCLHVSEPERVVLGDWIDLQGSGDPADLPAIAMWVAKADWKRAECPDTGPTVILSDPMHWEHEFEIGGDVMNEPSCPCRSVQRLYFASIGYASHKHLLVVALQSYGPVGDVDAAMASLQAAAQPILDSLVAPAIVVDN